MSFTLFTLELQLMLIIFFTYCICCRGFLFLELSHQDELLRNVHFYILSFVSSVAKLSLIVTGKPSLQERHSTSVTTNFSSLECFFFSCFGSRNGMRHLIEKKMINTVDVVSL